METKKLACITLIPFLITLNGCATDDPNRRAKTGAVIGTVIGGVLGHQVEGDKGRFIGAAVGAIGGATVGNYMDKQQRAFEEALAQEQQNHELEIERVEDNLLKLSLNSEVSFDFNSAAINPAFESSHKSCRIWQVRLQAYSRKVRRRD